MIFVSVDGGATKTISVCFTEDGVIQGVGVSGPSNFRNIGINKTQENLNFAIGRSLKMAESNRSEVAQYSFALAGVKDSKRSTEIIESFIGELKLGTKVSILNDGEAGFNCRFPGKDGIIGAPGTGMIAYARKGEIFDRASGWGWFIGDEGGAFYIARRAIQESAKVYDGRNESESKLPEVTMKYFNSTEPRQIVNEIYTEPIEIRKIAGFAKTVSRLADIGDTLATSIIQEAANEAASCILALRKRLFNDRGVEFSGYGGVYRAGDLYWNSLKEKVLNSYPDMIPVKPLYGYHAVLGSVYTTLESIGNGEAFDPEKEVRYLENKLQKVSDYEKEEFLMIP